MKLKFAPLVFAGVLSLFAIDCSDEPGAVGLGVLPTQDTLQVASHRAFATSDTTFLSRVVGGASTLLVGKYQMLEAVTLLSFNGLTTIPSDATIDTATLSLRVNYRFKDSSGTAGFEVHKFLRSFTNSGFTWDTATAAGAYSDTVSGSLLQSITPLDSLLSLRIDTILIRQWMQTGSGSAILLPAGNIVVGFSPLITVTVDYRPLLTIKFHENSDTEMTLSFRSSSAIFVADGEVPPHPGAVVAQSGIAYRGIVRFDSLTVPYGASITQAILEVPADTTASLTNTFYDDNIIAYLLRKNVYPYDSLAFGTKCSPSYDSAQQKVYRADIKVIVQRWVTREPNYGLLVRASGELSTFDRLVMYGASAASRLRPKLTITYTVFP